MTTTTTTTTTNDVAQAPVGVGQVELVARRVSDVAQAIRVLQRLGDHARQHSHDAFYWRQAHVAHQLNQQLHNREHGEEHKNTHDDNNDNDDSNVFGREVPQVIIGVVVDQETRKEHDEPVAVALLLQAAKKATIEMYALPAKSGPDDAILGLAQAMHKCGMLPFDERSHTFVTLPHESAVRIMQWLNGLKDDNKTVSAHHTECIMHIYDQAQSKHANGNKNHTADAAASTSTSTSSILASTTSASSNNSIALRALRPEDAATVDINWKYRHPPYSQQYIRSRIEHGETVGLYVSSSSSSDKPVLAAWALQQSSGAIGMLHTLDEYRRRGYAKMVVQNLVSKMDDRAYCYIVTDNDASAALFASLGFCHGPRFDWIVTAVPDHNNNNKQSSSSTSTTQCSW